MRDGGDFVRREVELGARGTARSQVVEGLAPGDVVLLVPAAGVDPAVAADAEGDDHEDEDAA